MVEQVASLMDANAIGSVVIIDDGGKPLGIMTERDIVVRVVAKGLSPARTRAGAMMSAPLITVPPDTDINEAAKVMRQHRIRRLIVMEQEEMVGLVGSNDIVSIIPTLIAIISETANITRRLPITREIRATGYCERCRQWSGSLTQVDGSFICEECRVQ
jgi:signal-transduction protein with cAMP-binding, CBS, and nucleotidyltransferase domain